MNVRLVNLETTQSRHSGWYDYNLNVAVDGYLDIVIQRPGLHNVKHRAVLSWLNDESKYY